MAAVVSLLGTATFNTTSGSKTVTATPAVGDLIVLVTAHSGNTATTAPTDNNSGGGGTYTLVNTAVKATSADTMKVWVRDALITSATSTVFTHAPGTTTGGGLVVVDVQGMGKVGTSALVQSAIQSNIASGTPAPVLGATPKSYNPIIGAVFNASNVATLTPRTSYSELADLGYNTPATGLEVMSRNSGETSATITWGSTSPSAFASIAVELNSTILHIADTSLSGAGTVSFVGKTTQKAVSSFTSTGSLSTSPRVVKFVDSSLSSIGTISVTGIIKKLVDASLSSSGTISSTYTWRQNYNGYRDTEEDNQRITEAGDFRITERFIDAQASLSALGTLSSDGTLIQGNQTYFGLASFTGTGGLEAQGKAIRYGTGSYSGLGSISVTPNLKLKGANSFTGTGTITSDGRTLKLGISDLNAVGTLSPTALRRVYAVVNGNVNASKIAAAERYVFGVVDLQGIHSGTFTPKLTLKPTFNRSATGTISITPKFTTKGVSSLSAAGTLVSTGYRLRLGASSLSASGTLVATAFDSTMYVKVSGVWKTSIPYVKYNNVWKRPLAIYKKQSGVWTRAN